MRINFISLLFLGLFCFQTILAQTGSEIRVIPQKGHNGWIRCLALSSDGKLLLTGSNDQTIILWDAISGKELKVFAGHKDEVQSLKFLPNNKMFFSGSANGEVLLWNVFLDEPVNGILTNGPVTDIDISPEGNEIAISTLHGLVGHSSIKSLAIPIQLVLDSSAHTFVALTRDESLVYLKNDTIVIRKSNQIVSKFPISQLDDIKTVKQPFTQRSDLKKQSQAQQEKDMRNFESSMIPMIHKAGSLKVPNNIYRRPYLITHDKKSLVEVMPTDKNKIILWNLSSAKKELEISTNLSEINQLATSSNDSLLAASNEHGVIFIYNLQKRTTIGYFNPTKDSTIGLGFAFSRDGSRIFIAIKESVEEINLSDKSIRNVFRGYADTVIALRFSDDGKGVLVQQNEIVKTFQTNPFTSEKLVTTKKGQGSKGFFEVSNDYSDFTSLFNNEIAKKTILEMGFSFLHVNSFIESTDLIFRFTGKLIARKFKETGKGDSISLRHSIKKIYFFPDKNVLAAYTDYDQIFLIKASQKLIIVDSIQDIRNLSNLDISADGNFLVCASTDRQLDVLNIKTNKKVLSFSVPYGDNIRQSWGHGVTIPHIMRCNPKQNYCVLTTWSGTMFVMDLNIRKTVHAYDSHTDLITFMEFSESGEYLLTYSIDNTLRLWKCSNKQDSGYTMTLLATYYLLNQKSVTLLPDNYYYGPKETIKYMGFVKDGTPYSFEQFDVKFNRPDKILEAIESEDTSLIKAYYKGYLKRIRRLGIDTSAFTEGFSLPEADFANRDSIGYDQTISQLNLHIVGKDSSSQLDRFNIWINETPLFGTKGYSLRSRNTNKLDTTLMVALSDSINNIETSVTDVNGIESYRIPLPVNYTPPKQSAAKTYFIGIGIDKFKDNSRNLSWSVTDIRNLADSLKSKYKGNITIDTLFNQDVTLERVKALKQTLYNTTINDKVIIAYSGHGLLSDSFDYYLSTYNVNFSKPEDQGLSYDVLEDLLDSIPARKKLMLLDACHSGEVDKEEMEHYRKVQDKLDSSGIMKGTILENTDSSRLGMQNSFELMQQLFVNVGRSTGATVISAAAGTQFALEKHDLKDGVFTYSILEYMKEHGNCTVNELKQYVNKRVAELTEGLQQPTARTENINYDWKIW